MPPTEQPDAPMQGMGQAPAGDMAPPMPQGVDDGSVMISMPKVAFDAIHQLISQLASGVDSLAQSVAQQTGASAGGPPTEMPPSAPAGGSQGGAGSDEDFLNSMAKEGSQK